MSKASVTFACGLYDRMVPLYTGEIRPDGIELNFLAIESPREIFDRMGGAQEFECAEMSSSEFIARFAHGSCPFVALPVFPSRVFRHSFIVVNRKHVSSPKELAGKRIGVPLYTMTAAIFMRGMLQHDHGVDFAGATWIEGSMNEAHPHGNPTRLPLLKSATIEANVSGKSLSELLDKGEISAVMGTSMPVAMKRNPDIVRLFPDYRDKEMDYYRRTKIFPIMHTVVIRRDVFEKNPFVATSLYNAFCASKDRALALMRHGAPRYMLPWMGTYMEETERVFGKDPWPYGIDENRPTIEALVQYMAEQGLIAAPMPIEKLFVPTYGLH